jgi:hypothetical protein
MIFYKWFTWIDSQGNTVTQMVLPIFGDRGNLYHAFEIRKGKLFPGAVGKLVDMGPSSNFQPNQQQKQEMIQILFERLS